MSQEMLDKNYKKLARMASAYHEMLQELQTQITSELCSKASVTDDEARSKFAEMQEILIDAMLGLDGLSQVNKREPFSA